MARFQSATEIFDIWIDNGSLWRRRFAIGTPEPAPQLVEVRVPAAPVDMQYDVAEAANATYRAMQRDLLAGGWSRVHDPVHEHTYPDDPRDEDLERALRENPDDDETWLVYADTLIQRGHPRGQLIALESAPVKNVVQRAERENDSRKLRHAAAAVLVGPIVGRHGLSLGWKRGFIHGATLRASGEDVLFELLTHPSGRMLRELALECGEDARLYLDLLFHVAPPLRKLLIHSYDVPASLGDLGALGTVFPQLEDVELGGNNQWRFDGLALPRAKRFVLDTTNLQPSTLRAIVDAPWPALEELGLTFGAQTLCTYNDLRLLFELVELPRIVSLSFLDAPFGDQIVEGLLASPTARLVSVLDLRGCVVDNTTARRFLDARPLLREDFRVHMSGSRIGDETWNELVRAGLVDY